MKRNIKEKLFLPILPDRSRRLQERLLLFRYRSLPSRLFLCIIVISFCVILSVCLFFCSRERISDIPACAAETEGFRSMQLKPEIVRCLSTLEAQREESRFEILAVLMAAGGFYCGEERKSGNFTLQEYDLAAEYYRRKQPQELALLAGSYQTLLSDLVYFPVMKSSRQEIRGIAYAESWLSERSYQNVSHAHEGTDIMALNNKRGYYPIVSMTDGVVERLGWLEKGGYRVGIRSPGGAYLYYAHLYRYADGLKEGDTVRAGQLLGFMGDSGYSKIEGTVGNFDVHLHLGIYLKTEHYEELSVNPYWILKLMEDRCVVGDY